MRLSEIEVSLSPRHLAMFCLTQLACIAGGWLMLRLLQKIFFRMQLDTHGVAWPRLAYFLAEWGWTLFPVPIVCVLMIPRHAEGEEPKDGPWWMLVPLFAGVLCIVLPVAAMVFGVIKIFRGV